MREALRKRQSQLLRALVAEGPVPEGYDPQRMQLAAASLANKRAREVAQSWAAMVAELPDYARLFRTYAALYVRPPGGSPVWDGYRFAHWLQRKLKVVPTGVAWALFHWRETPQGLVWRKAPGWQRHGSTLWLRLGRWRKQL